MLLALQVVPGAGDRCCCACHDHPKLAGWWMLMVQQNSCWAAAAQHRHASSVQSFRLQRMRLLRRRPTSQPNQYPSGLPSTQEC
jgi:hypothetical protein